MNTVAAGLTVDVVQVAAVTIVKRNGRFLGVLKDSREYADSKTFDRRQDAKNWLARERAAMAGGIDPRAGKERMCDVLVRWLAVRESTVAKETYRADQVLLRLTPTSVLAVQVGADRGSTWLTMPSS